MGRNSSLYMCTIINIITIICYIYVWLVISITEKSDECSANCPDYHSQVRR